MARYRTTMETSIQVSTKLLAQLRSMKLHEKESYEDLLWDLVEDRMELNEETRKAIARAEKDIAQHRVHRWTDVKKELDINV